MELLSHSVHTGDSVGRAPTDVIRTRAAGTPTTMRIALRNEPRASARAVLRFQSTRADSSATCAGYARTWTCACWIGRGSVLRVALVVVVVAMLACGCAPRMRQWSPPQNPDALSDVAFLHYLSTVPVATVDEAGRAVLMLTDGEPDERTSEARMRVLLDHGYVSARWHLKPGHVLTRGALAHMLARVCDLPRSVGRTILGSTGLGDQRDAIRSCADAGILAYGTPDESVSGGELLGAISAADARLEEQSGQE